MKNSHLLALLLLASGCSSPTLPPPVASSTPSAATPRPVEATLASLDQGACFSLTVLGESEAKYRDLQPLKPGTELCLHLMALKKPCVALVGGFAGNGATPSPDFRPAHVELQPGQPVDLRFSLKASVPQTLLYVAIADPKGEPAKDSRKWLDAWQKDPSQSDPIRSLQGQFASWLGPANSPEHRSAQLPDQLGGVTSTSAQTGNPQLKDEDRAAASQMETSKKTNNAPSASGGAAAPPVPVYDWRTEVDWVSWSQDQPCSFLYKVKMSEP